MPPRRGRIRRQTVAIRSREVSPVLTTPIDTYLVGNGGMDGNPVGMEVRSTAKFPHAEFFPPPPAPRGPIRWVARLRADRQELVRFWPVVQNMVVQELRVRYQRSFLGFVWTLLNPILMMAILSWVFSRIMDKVDHYPLFLFAGMVPWSFLSICLNDCAFSIINNEGLIRKIYLPKMVFPLNFWVLIALVTFALTLACPVPAPGSSPVQGRRFRCSFSRLRLRCSRCSPWA